MTKKIILLFCLLVSPLLAQWDLSVSMGLDFKSAPSFKDYINSNFALPNTKISSVKSSISFTGEIDYKLQPSLSLGLEYNQQIDSYNSIGNYEISFVLHRPSLMCFYVLPGNGYQFKFGGGFGIRKLFLTERIQSTEKYTADGFGLVFKAKGNTKLSKDFYALISIDFRYEAIEDISNSTGTIYNNVLKENLNMNSFSFGIHLGVTYSF